MLYLCKDVETFGSGIRKIYSLCNTEGSIRIVGSDVFPQGIAAVADKLAEF